MRPLIITLTLSLLAACAQAQDPGMQAAQMASQQAQMAAQQASQQAMTDMQMASQNATNAMNAAQQQAMNSQFACTVPTPSFSVKTGAYSTALSVKITSGRGAAIYYTTDGWTPTTASTRYTGEVPIDSTTTLQAIAVSRCTHSRVATAVYTLSGVQPAPAVAQNVTILHGLVPTVSNAAAAAAAASGKLMLPQGTAVPLIFTSDVNSKTAHVGDKISLILAEDLKAGDAVVVKKGTASVVTITEVDKPRVMGVPGEVVFKADSLQVDGTTIKLRGIAAKQGQDKMGEASGLMVFPVPVGLFVHGKEAEIKQGAVFTAYVDADTAVPAN